MINPTDLGLPHREPFLFVDAVSDLEPGVAARGTKTFGGDEAFFAGHFPGDPIVPGVILVEALSQLAGIVGASGAADGARYLLTAIRLMKFPGAARPGDLISLSAKSAGGIGGLGSFEVVAKVGDRLVAEGRVVLSAVTS